MRIQLVSYVLKIQSKDKVYMTADIINSSTSDLIVFSGSTLDTIEDVFKLQGLIKNKKSTALIEVSRISLGDINSEIINCPFIIAKGEIVNMHTFQCFATSDSIENNIFLAETFINELETRRKFKVKGCNCLVLLCGENNILKNLQSNCNNVVVRIDNKSLVQRFKQVLNSSDIILNIIHQPQYGNQNKLHKRREFFSQNNRTYLSTNNCKKLSSSVKSTQYVYRNGIKIDCPEPIIDDNGRYMYRVFSL